MLHKKDFACLVFLFVELQPERAYNRGKNKGNPAADKGGEIGENKMFELLKERFVAYKENEKRENAFFIRNGFCESWANEHKNGDPDNGLMRYSTETRWQQYKNGDITREKAIEYAINRNNKKIDKEINEKIAYLDYVAKAPDISFIRIEIEWRKSYTWGMNPAAEVTTNADFEKYTGYASGCGYDKESAAVAMALDKCPGVMKVLYTLKENALKAGGSDFRKEVVTKVDNRNILGYGAGYSVIPYFEGGVGVSCFWSILKKAGFEVRGEHGKTWDVYRLEKDEK